MNVYSIPFLSSEHLKIFDRSRTNFGIITSISTFLSVLSDGSPGKLK